MSKICLVIPPSPFLLDERVFTSLGILKVASSLRQHGHKIDVLDLSGIKNPDTVLDDYIAKTPVQTIGITATTPQMPAVWRLIKRIPKGIVKIIGGPHVSLMHSAAKKKNSRAIDHIETLKEIVDVIVCGDGELSILEAVKNTQKIVDADDPKSALFLTNDQFSELPLPARDLVDLQSYSYSIDGVNATSLISQLGCPFRCTFCGGRNSPFLRRIRLRDPDSVLEEIKHLHELYGYKGFMFYDDELNVSKSMPDLMRKLIAFQKQIGESFRLRGFLKSELLNDEQAELMYDAGFRWILTGFESGSPRILENIAKNATREDNTKAVELCKKYGLKVKALMSIGHAGESAETIDETKNWLLEVKPHDFDCTVITVYPGTPYFDEAIQKNGVWTYTAKNGDVLHQDSVNWIEDADYYKGDPEDGYIARVWTDNISKKDLVLKRDSLENEVRTKLNIPFNTAAPAQLYEHSMGALPQNILRTS